MHGWDIFVERKGPRPLMQTYLRLDTFSNDHSNYFKNVLSARNCNYGHCEQPGIPRPRATLEFDLITHRIVSPTTATLSCGRPSSMNRPSISERTEQHMSRSVAPLGCTWRLEKRICALQRRKNTMPSIGLSAVCPLRHTDTDQKKWVRVTDDTMRFSTSSQQRLTYHDRRRWPKLSLICGEVAKGLDCPRHHGGDPVISDNQTNRMRDPCLCVRVLHRNCEDKTQSSPRPIPRR